MVSMSIIMPTARGNHPIIGLPGVHMLRPTIDSLKNQTFNDFELIIVDALYDKRQKLFQGEPFHADKLPFPVRHIPIERNSIHNHRFWMDNRRWDVCGTLNTGIIHAKGELLIRVDDCSEFESDYLKKFWEGYQSGYFPMAMHIKYLNGMPERLNKEHLYKDNEINYNISFGTDTRDLLLKKSYGESGLVRDSRYDQVKSKGERMIAPHEWYYGYSSISLEAVLKVNGYDELFDGDKSLEDVDMGSRLDMAGYNDKTFLDVDHQVIEHEHAGPDIMIDGWLKPIKCNYAIYLMNRNKNRWKANSGVLDNDDIRFIVEESLKPPCSPTPNFYDGNCSGTWWDMWLNNRPVFDLREERKLYHN